MRTINTDITINAAQSDVWRELTDFGSYPEWNPFVKKLVGTFSEGSPIVLWLRTAFGPTVMLPATFRQVVPGSSFAWGGGAPRIFTANHYFILEAIDETQTRLVHGEEFTGALDVVLRRGITESLYTEMNEALKMRVET